MIRVQCMGVGRPCPAWWYEEPHPGPRRKRCPQCQERRYWRAFERRMFCPICEKPLKHPKTGRPRIVCCPKCYTALRRSRKRRAFERRMFCPICEKPLKHPKTGRPRIVCCPKCYAALRRSRKNA